MHNILHIVQYKIIKTHNERRRTELIGNMLFETIAAISKLLLLRWPFGVQRYLESPMWRNGTRNCEEKIAIRNSITHMHAHTHTHLFFKGP